MAGPCFWITQALVPACFLDDETLSAEDGLTLVDIEIKDGLIVTVRPAASQVEPAGAARARQVWPGLIDVHTHLDKGHIWPRAENPDGTFEGAMAAVLADRPNWTAADIRRRFDFALRCAYAHGTVAIRTHIDSEPPQHHTSWPVFCDLRELWWDRVRLQGVSLVSLDLYEGKNGDELADLVAECDGVLGAFVVAGPDTPAQLDRLFHLAATRGLDLDFHVDESGDPDARALHLVAEAALRNDFPGKVLCGHCCALAIQPATEVRKTLELVARAGIAVVSLPMCNLYLQDRVPGRTPRWRGISLLHEMAARGIPVALASDNCRDPFFGYGDLDLLEVFREATRIAHLDRPIGNWPAAISRTPAALMDLPDRGLIRPGAPADLILFRGRHWSELLSRPESNRTILRHGRPIDTTPPDYRELDE